jgi:serine/threonine protein kinase
MDSRSDFSDDALVAFARTLSSKVNRNALQQILIEARLLPRNSSREELRRICPNPSMWISFVRDRLPAPESRPGTLRALSLLVNAYLASSNIDPRVETSIRKARQAADRGDLTRIGREFQRLHDYSLELSSLELRKPDLLLFICAGSDRARDSVAQAISSISLPDKSAVEQVSPQIAVFSPIESIAASPSTQVSDQLKNQTDAPSKQGPAVSLLPASLGWLEEIRSSKPAIASWNIEPLVKGRISAPKVEWPEVTPIFDKLRSLAEALTLSSQSIISLPGSTEQLARVQPILVNAKTMLTEKIDELGLELDGMLESVSTTVESALSAVQPELTERVTAIRQKLANKDDLYPKQDVIDVLESNQELLGQKLSELSATIKALEELAPYLASEAQEILKIKARHLALRFRTDELHKLLRDTETKTEEPRRLRQRINDAASAVLDFLEGDNSINFDSETTAFVRSAIFEGDGERAISIVREFALRRESAARMNGAVSLPSDISPKFPEHDQIPALQPKVERKLEGFVPRDRITARSPQLPSTADAMVEFLRDRCLAEIRRGSVAGAIDHALDILSLAGTASLGGSVWQEVGLTILASLPATPGGDTNWGHSLADALRDSILHFDSSTLSNYLGNLIVEPNFGEALTERFVHTEIDPCIDRLAGALYASVSAHRPYLLEDVARSIGSGVAYGDQSVCKKLLLSLARAAQETGEVLVHAQKWLDNERAYSTVAERNRVSDWIAEGIKAYHTAVGERNRTITRGSSKASALRLQIPVSVTRNGGFGFLPGLDTVEFGLLLSNQQNSPLSSVEVALPKVRNPWLAEDILCSTGPISGMTRHLLQIKARVVQELTQDMVFEAGWQGRYREPGSRETKFEDGRINELSFANSRSLVIENYEGAGGKPLILEGDTLRYSSNSVKRALTEILSGLSGKGIAALVIGRRRRGKTSILYTIAQHKEIRERYTVISDSWEDIPSRTLSTTLRHLGMVFDRAARTLNVEIDPLEHRLNIEIAAGWTVFQHWLDDLATKLKSPTRLLLLLDEFQKWITLLDPESLLRVLSILRGLFNRPETGTLSISIVLSGLTNIRDLTRASVDFENAFKIFSIEAFTLPEADALIRSNTSIEFDSRAVIRIRDLAGGNPFLINLLCNDIAARLRELGRAYCLPEDVQRVVSTSLEDRDNSRVWSFLQYLLKEGEEDHASEIAELPTLLALAHTRKMRGTGRNFIGSDEIFVELAAAGVPCDRQTLNKHLVSAAQNELVVQRGQRFSFSNGWLAEWLSVSESLLPIKPEQDKELVLGRFRLVEFMDRGGQATVYEAQDTRASNRSVIVKIYPRTQAVGVSSGVLREAQLLHSIEHTAVVQCIEFGSDPEKGDVIVLERVKGEKLRELLAKRPKHSNDLIGMEGNLKVQVKFIEQIGAALCECHRVGVVHKDLKPENLIVQSVAGLWLPKIIDFGLATNVSELGSDVRTTGSYTPGYVAPERYRGEGRRAAADVYSLGVVAYELLTGSPPFPTDLLRVREAQESGTYTAAKEVRPEIPLRLSELIGEMLSPDPSDRPNAFTLMGKLASSLEVSDWTSNFESATKAYGDGDAETACNYFERAVFGAPDAGRRTKQYLDALSYLVDTADSCNRLLSIANEIIQPLVAAAVHSEEAVPAFENLITKVLSEPAVDPRKREVQRSAIRTLAELLSDIAPNLRLRKAAELLLKSTNSPAVWPEREEIYLLGLAYKDSNLVPVSLVGQWCLTAAKKLRERDGNLLSAQIWLRRAARIGIEASAEYRQEQETLLKLIRQTANPITLPPISQQEAASSTVGDGERGHLNVHRIQIWVDRLLRLHPYVQAVRRVRKDPNLALSPTRLLQLENIAQHLTSGTEIMEPARIIPAVLDESYCIPKGSTTLRINIILPAGTTISQREAVMSLLREDGSLFGSRD